MTCSFIILIIDKNPSPDKISSCRDAFSPLQLNSVWLRLCILENNYTV